MQIKRVHYLSGILLAVFTGIHLINHSLSISGATAHIQAMNTLRLVYRNPLIETLLLLAVVVQISSGLKLIAKKRKLNLSGIAKIQVYSGIYLAVFLIIHVGAVMTGRYMLQLDTNIYFGAAGINTFPFNLFFIPYYTLAILSIVAHISAVHAMKMKYALVGFTAVQQAKVIFGIGVVWAIAILYGLTDGFAGMAIPTDYLILVGK